MGRNCRFCANSGVMRFRGISLASQCRRMMLRPCSDLNRAIQWSPEDHRMRWKWGRHNAFQSALSRKASPRGGFLREGEEGSPRTALARILVREARAHQGLQASVPYHSPNFQALPTPGSERDSDGRLVFPRRDLAIGARDRAQCVVGWDCLSCPDCHRRVGVRELRVVQHVERFEP